MDKERILKEAQKIAAKYSFWMVSGNIEHLYGYAYEHQGIKYELEIKFKDDFPNQPPKIVFHNDIKELLGEINLITINNWTPNSQVVEIVNEIRNRIQDALKPNYQEVEVETPPSTEPTKKEPPLEDNTNSEKSEENQKDEEYITPDLDVYPPDFEYESYLTPTDTIEEKEIIKEDPSQMEYEEEPAAQIEPLPSDVPLFIDENELPLAISTELGLLQQEYAYDQMGERMDVLNVYLTITVSKTFLITIDFQNYPERPVITLPDEIQAIINNPYSELEILRNWNSKQPPHIVEIIRELEKRLSFINQIELESKKIRGEYKCESDVNDFSALDINLVTYGFKEYPLRIDLKDYPNVPNISLSSELQTLIDVPITNLKSYINWESGESEAVELIREISWLVDKNSRIRFEIELLKEHYKNINYDPDTSILKLDMKGKMKTQDLTFQFQIDLPQEYPMKMPSIKVLNEFEIEAHEKIKNDLQGSFKDFYDEWTPFSYLVDVFNLISKKIFEISVVSCVICHKIDCPTCSLKIAGTDADTCHVDCPYCERSYHKHCWDQTIRSFGKCGFCLKTPPPNLMPD
jgi:ubiquitin-protein ligase